MNHPAARLARFTKQGPKRHRRTRRDYGEGQYSQWANCTTHFQREREARRLALDWAAALEAAR